MSDCAQRFSRLQRLYSETGIQRLRQAHVCVIGMGGVGSWAVEALARSAVGNITLIDFDKVCPTNFNRQLPAIQENIGQPKVEIMARRVSAINPGCVVRQSQSAFSGVTAKEILSVKFDYVLDAIDQLENKCLLIAECRGRGIPVLSSGGAAGRQDPCQVRIDDLALSTDDGLLRHVRRKLRDEYGFPREPKSLFNVASVFSREPRTEPRQKKEGAGASALSDHGYGTVAFVTGAFGLAAASHIVRAIASEPAC